MTTWVLVLILSSANGIGMTTVAGFTSKSSCHDAAAAWEKNYADRWTGPNAKAYCVEVK